MFTFDDWNQFKKETGTSNLLLSDPDVGGFMMPLFYLVIYLAAAALVLYDKDLATANKPCEICLPRYLMLAVLTLLFLGAEAFALVATHKVWVISGVMALSISAFLFGVFFIWERKKWLLALLQMGYVFLITVHFYSWW
jgi:hypothetical protein